MDPQSLLAQLEPLREPPAIGWWPLAPGWWLVIALALAALLFAAVWVRRKWLSNRYRRLAQSQLIDWRNQDQGISLEKLNRLLKVTALQAWPSDDVASLHGTNWITFLSATTKQQDNADFSPLIEVYRSPSALAPEPLIESALRWISQHHVSPLSVIKSVQPTEGKQSDA